MFVKVCCIADLADARLAVSAGAAPSGDIIALPEVFSGDAS
jgi:hypothetical protein